MSELRELRESQHQIISTVKNAFPSKPAKSVIGSACNSDIVKTFSWSVVSKGDLMTVTPTKSDEFKRIIKSFNDEVSKLVTNHGLGLSEVAYIQPTSSHLVNELIGSYFPINDKLTMVTGEGSETEYQVDVDACTALYHVKGRTDKVIRYCNIPVGIWEDKTPSINLKAPKAFGQTLVQMEAFARQFFDMVKQPPPRFYGILSNGKRLILITRRIHLGDIVWTATDSIDYSNLELATRVMEMFFHSMTLSMKVIDDMFSATLCCDSVATLVLEDLDGDEDGADAAEDGREQRQNDNTGGASGSRLNPAGAQRLVREDTSQKENAGSRGSARSMGHRKALGILSSNTSFSALTEQNLMKLNTRYYSHPANRSSLASIPAPWTLAQPMNSMLSYER